MDSYNAENAGRTCIIIDDDRWALYDIQNVFPLKEFGFTVTGMYMSAETALEALKTLSPDLIITDICLGGKNGLELIEESKRNGFTGEFIIISGYSEFDYARRALEQDVSTYLLKPIDVNECRKALKKVINRLESLAAGGTEPEEKDIVDKIRSYMQTHYAERLSLGDIAAVFHMNQTYFSEYFSKRFGKKFVDYRNEVRIEHAKILLTKKTLSLQNISILCGFENPGYFSTLFKKQTGMTPEQYRKERQ